ncbi:protein FAM98B-like [Drosophila gunungcola]|uniref:Uncharacterized protein n=1 Tax=Drosophila gunungcola TaxID=103775 RepID=A0A9P9YMZ4_9MUSC|nr:protein FAM98B-like [Drosophila gunungcola]KAI8039978.1 hypothetical protein M5D96_007403 [Drosophila gunungcola]
MRLTLLAFIGILCLAYAYALDDATNEDDRVIGLLDVADQGANHANDGAREARQWGWGGRGGGWGGGWGGGHRGGWGGGHHGGWGGRGGWGGGGWGRHGGGGWYGR